jgi:hypothetical protein
MDVGQRPSRQRRHLPTHGTALTQQQQQKQQQSSMHDSNNSNDEATDATSSVYQSLSKGRGRERKQQAKKRMKTSFEHLMVSKRKSTTLGSMEGGGIQWRLWFWRACVLWLGFLCVRIMLSVWRGDITSLGWNQYLTQHPYRWWWQ